MIGPQLPEAAATIAHRAEAIGAPLYRCGADWRVERAGDRLRYLGASGAFDLPLPNLAGAHQIDNAGSRSPVSNCWARSSSTATPCAAA